MLGQLIKFELKYHARQGVFWLGMLAFMWMAVLLTTQSGSAVFYANSAYSIVRVFAFVSMQIIFAVAVLAGATSLRDSQNDMEAMIFTTPVDKFHYLASRFIGLVLATCILFVMIMITMVVSLYFVDPTRVGPIHLSYYLYGFMLLILPNILLCASVVFATAMLTKNNIAVYISALVVFVFHGVGSVMGGSPMVVSGSGIFQEGIGLAALIEPYGAVAFMEQSAYWTVEERNTNLPVLEGNLLFNRLLWITVSISLFALTYKSFSFRKALENVKTDKVTESVPVVESVYKPLKSNTHFSQFSFKVWLSKLKIEYLSMVKGKPFIVLLIVAVVFNIGGTIGQILSGPITNASPYFALTEMIIELIQSPIIEIGTIVAIFYAVELYWNERAVNIGGLIDVTPTRNATFYLAKLATTTAICFTIIAVTIFAAMIFQLSQGQFDLQPHLYLILFFYCGMPLFLNAVLALFLQRFAKNKAFGLALVIVAYVVLQYIRGSNFAHPLWVFAFSPDFIISDMADTLYHADAFNWYSLYWLSLCGVLAVFSVKMWQRGISNYQEAFSPTAKKVLAGFVLTAVLAGSYVFYQVNVFNEFFFRDTVMDRQEQYEKEYIQYKDVQYPTVTDIKVDVAIYPDERRYTAKGRYIIENKSDKAMDKLLVAVLRQHQITYDVTIEGATLDKVDTFFQKYFFTLDKPLKPGQTTQLNFELDVSHNAFARLDGEHYVTKGGSYIELEDVMPRFGYVSRYEMGNVQERLKRGLPAATLDYPALEMNTVGDDWVVFETTVSTVKGQTVVTPGDLQKQWEKDGRSYFYYKTDQKISRQFAYTSADFTIAKSRHNDLDILIYHHASHDKDIELTREAIEKSIDYFAENYTPYQHKSYKAVELPYFSSKQSFGTSIPGMYLGVENRFFNLNNEGATFNPQLRGVSHEFSHQYWGGYIEPHYGLAGSRMLTEVLSKYSELVIHNKAYGKYASNIELNASLKRYLSMRGFSSRVEKPLFNIGSSPMVYYPKGKHSMHALMDLIGEANINKALKSFLLNHGYPNKPTSLDLLDEFYAVAADDQIDIINDLFKRVVFHELRIDSADIKTLEDGTFETTLAVTTLKTVVDQATNKEFSETINDSIEIGFYSGFPKVDNANMTLLKKVKFSEDNSMVTILSDHKPAYIQIDPNRYRIDRSVLNNMMKVE